MPIVYRRTAVRRYRYGGSGIIDTIARAMFSGGARAISRGASSAAAQKVANVVVNGATTAAKESANAALRGATIAAQRAGEKAVNEAVRAVVEKVQRKKKKKKKKKKVKTWTYPATAVIPTTTANTANTGSRRININSLIDGSGIVLD